MIEVRSHVRKAEFIIFTPKTAGLVGVSLSLSVGFSIEDDAMDVARSTSQGFHCHTNVIYLLPLMGIKKEV